jgi:hypothetical protein
MRRRAADALEQHQGDGRVGVVADRLVSVERPGVPAFSLRRG